MFIANLVLQFISRKVFLDYLGTEIVGLNTTAMNILQFLNLAELGIGSAIGSTLYKPIYDNDRRSIIEIVGLLGHIYRRVAYIILLASAVLMGFFPLIFEKMELPMWYAYASFGALLFSSLLMYFANYHTVLLSADQKDYKIQYTYRLSTILKVLAQTLAVCLLPYGYIWWLVLEVLFSIGGSVALRVVVRRTYPYLDSPDKAFKELRRAFPAVLQKVRQLFFHKSAYIVSNQLSPLIIYAYANLTLVAVYGNYLMLFSGFVQLMLSMFMGINSGIGNLVAQGDREAVLRFFKEFFSMRMLLSTVLCFLFYTLGPSFIVLWVGPQYLLPTSTLLIMTLTLFVALLRLTLDNYIYAYGLFSDVWAPLAEVALGIGLSVLGGHYYGLNGILLGVLVSSALHYCLWKPYFLFRYGLKEPVGKFVIMAGLNMLAVIIACAVSYILCGFVTVDTVSFGGFIAAGVIYTAIITVVTLVLMLVLRCGVGDTVKRIAGLLGALKKKS